MVWFVRFGAGATAQRRAFETRGEAVAYAHEMRAWQRVEGLTGRVIVGWAIDYVE